jgi:hypothetical protein
MKQKNMVIGTLLALTIALAACSSDASSSPPLPMEVQLIAGTLLLEESDYPVTPEQAQTLVPAWQMFQALRQSGTASEEEINTVVEEIQAAMTPEQLAAIEEMQLTAEDVRDTAQSMGINPQGPPAGMTPADMLKLSAEERAALMSSRAGQGLVDKLIEFLEARAGEA